MASETKPARVWLSDGSGAPFSDLDPVSAAHPTILGRPAPYQGCIDPAVYVGEATVAGTPGDVFVPEAEWCVSFPDGVQPYLEDPRRVEPATPVVLQGLIEGKWLNRLLGTWAWRPASVGNNLLADGPGIRTTLGAIEAGEIGEVLVTYRHRQNGQDRTREQRTTLADLRGQHIPELVVAVLEHCRSTRQAVDWIDCSAQGVAAAVVNEPERLRDALRSSGVRPADLVDGDALQRVVDVVIRGILADDLAALPGTPMEVIVRNQRQTVVGQGRLISHPWAAD
ncbi:MAG: hypothetical protein M1118_11305 [Chloroflexi bacterium]|nr:hypothetical protein [Chloroflexota bacterium]